MTEIEAQLAWQALSKFRDDALHFEEQREKVAALFSALQAAILAYCANTAILGNGRLAIFVFVLFLAGFSALFTLKLRQYTDKGYARAAILMGALNERYPGAKLAHAFDLGDQNTKARRVSRVSLTWLWIALNLAIALVTSMLLLFGLDTNGAASPGAGVIIQSG